MKISQNRRLINIGYQVEAKRLKFLGERYSEICIWMIWKVKRR